MKVLLIEDERDLADSIVRYLRGNDFICEWADTIEATNDRISSHVYDCILLDLSLPDGHGFEILKELKKKNSSEGVIIISAKETLHSKIEGLNLGADDYITKPFHISELLARVQALVRRKNFQGNNIVHFQEIEIDTLAKSVRIGATPIDLTRKEMDLLMFMIGNQNRVLSKSTIAEHLSGDMADMLDNHDFVYAHIKNLKKKLHEAGCKDYIKTVYGLGYKWH